MIGHKWPLQEQWPEIGHEKRMADAMEGLRKVLYHLKNCKVDGVCKLPGQGSCPKMSSIREIEYAIRLFTERAAEAIKHSGKPI